MVPPIVGYPCPLRTRPVKHTVSGSCRPRERALILTLVNSVGILDLLTRTRTAVLPSSLSPSGAWLAERRGGSLPGGRVGTEDQADNRYPREPFREGLHRAIKDRSRSHAVCRGLTTARCVSNEPTTTGLQTNGSVIDADRLAQHVRTGGKNGTDPLLFHSASATEGVSARAPAFL